MTNSRAAGLFFFFYSFFYVDIHIQIVTYTNPSPFVILAGAINTKTLTKNHPDSPHFHPDSPHSLPHSPDSHPHFLYSHPDYPHSHRDSPHSQHSHPIPRVSTLISRVATLIPHFSIIPLIPFPDSPFRLLQIDKAFVSI